MVLGRYLPYRNWGSRVALSNSVLRLSTIQQAHTETNRKVPRDSVRLEWQGGTLAYIPLSKSQTAFFGLDHTLRLGRVIGRTQELEPGRSLVTLYPQSGKRREKMLVLTGLSHFPLSVPELTL